MLQKILLSAIVISGLVCNKKPDERTPQREPENLSSKLEEVKKKDDTCSGEKEFEFKEDSFSESLAPKESGCAAK